MAERVVLHVGTMKSGTTYLQSLLFQNKQDLAAQGIVVPGRAWGSQVLAVRQVLASGSKRPAWSRLVEQAEQAEKAAVVSMEFLGPQQKKVVKRVVSSFPGTEVHVVITARDLNRSLVSLWQETVQNGRAWTWEEYLEDVRATAPGEGQGTRQRHTAGGTFWRQQHIARMWSAWASEVGPERCTIVTLPPPGAAPSTLADRFAETAGLTFADLTPPKRGNPGLGLASVMVLRRINEHLEERGLRAEDMRYRKKTLAKDILSSRRSDEQPLGLEVEDWVRAQTEATVRRLQREGAPVVGDLAELEPVPVAGIQPHQVSAEQVADTAVYALGEILSSRAARAVRRRTKSSGKRGRRGQGGRDTLDRKTSKGAG